MADDDNCPPHINIKGDINIPFDVTTQVGNLVPNGNFDMEANFLHWELQDCVYQQSPPAADAIQHMCDAPNINIESMNDGVDGSKCIVFDKRYDLNENAATIKIDRAISGPINLAEITDQDEYFTISFKAKTIDTWPSPLFDLRVIDVTGNTANSLFQTSFAVSEDNNWQECVAHIKIDRSATTHIKIDLFYSHKTNTKCGVVYIDDVYMEVGRQYVNPPKCKDPFKSDAIQVDELGNYRVKENNKWKNFFPIGMMGGNYRTDVSLYEDHGFNHIARQSHKGGVDRIKGTSMYYSFALSFWLEECLLGACTASNLDDCPFGCLTCDSNNFGDLQRRLESIFDDTELQDRLLYYYIDNEAPNYHWEEKVTNVSNIIECFEQSYFNQLTFDEESQKHPLYLLNGTYGIARQYKASYDYPTILPNLITDDVADITGTYTGLSTSRFDLLNNIDGQRMPAVIAQINSVTDNSMGARVFAAIAHGAKGISYWVDTAPGNPNYIPDFPDCRQYAGQVIDMTCPAYNDENGLFNYIYDHLNYLDGNGRVVDVYGNMLFEEDGITPRQKTDKDGDGLFSEQLYNDNGSRILDINNRYLEQPTNPDDPVNPLGPFLPTNKHLVDVTEADWWDGFDEVTNDINDLLPIIRKPHWTDWTVSHDEGCGIDIGTRNFNGEGYLIIANLENNDKTVLLTIENLGYMPSQVETVIHSNNTTIDYGVSGEADSFQTVVILNSFEYGVYKLDNSNIECDLGDAEVVFTNVPTDNNGNADITANLDFVGDYSYSWDDGSAGDTKTNVCLGKDHSVSITNNTLGCSQSFTFEGQLQTGFPFGEPYPCAAITTNDPIGPWIPNGPWTPIGTFIPGGGTVVQPPLLGGGGRLATNLDQIEVWPNPADKAVNIELSSFEYSNATIKLYSLAGKEVLTQAINDKVDKVGFDVSNVNNGIYLIKIITDGQEIHTQKLTIAH